MKNASLARRIAPALAGACLPLAAAQALAQVSRTNSVLNEFEDWQQVPARNAALQRLADEAELIVVAQFDLARLLAAPPSNGQWTANIPGSSEGCRIVKFKGNCGRQILLRGDPQAFVNPAPAFISPGSFRESNDFILFLKAVDTNGLFACLDACPGGIRLYAGRGDSDHRKMLAGSIGGRLVVEGGRGYRSDRMCGPTNLRDALEGAPSGLKLTATSRGGATVELRFENAGSRPLSLPQEIRLFAPLLWAEIEDAATDRVLLSEHDYVIPQFLSPYKQLQTLPPGGATNVTVELPTGPLPAGATLRWALNNHVKPLAGSLPPGEHTVRLLFRPDKETLVMSNPVKVAGRPGGAAPEHLAPLDRPPAFVPRPDPKPDTPLPPLAQSLKGQIWFDTNRDGNWELYVMGANGSNAVNVTQTPEQDEFGVAISPDGRRIAYHAGAKGAGNGGVWSRWGMDNKQIWVADRDGKNARKVADQAITPGWWSDSSAVLYISKKDGFCMQNLESGAVTPLTKSVPEWLNFGPSMFAPGTRKLLGGGGLNSTLCGMTVVVDLDEQAQYKGFTALTTTYRGCTQRWLSPEGRRIIFAHHDPKHKGAIILWSMNPDGTDPQRFARSHQGWEGYGTYSESPDGAMYVCASWGNIYVGRYADGAQIQLTNKQGSNMSPQWRLDAP